MNISKIIKDNNIAIVYLPKIQKSFDLTEECNIRDFSRTIMTDIVNKDSIEKELINIFNSSTISLNVLKEGILKYNSNTLYNSYTKGFLDLYNIISITSETMDEFDTYFKRDLCTSIEIENLERLLNEISAIDTKLDELRCKILLCEPTKLGYKFSFIVGALAFIIINALLNKTNTISTFIFAVGITLGSLISKRLSRNINLDIEEKLNTKATLIEQLADNKLANYLLTKHTLIGNSPLGDMFDIEYLKNLLRQ